jgi:hypothetical protein
MFARHLFLLPTFQIFRAVVKNTVLTSAESTPVRLNNKFPRVMGHFWGMDLMGKSQGRGRHSPCLYINKYRT